MIKIKETKRTVITTTKRIELTPQQIREMVGAPSNARLFAGYEGSDIRHPGTVYLDDTDARRCIILEWVESKETTSDVTPESTICLCNHAQKSHYELGCRVETLVGGIRMACGCKAFAPVKVKP